MSFLLPSSPPSAAAATLQDACVASSVSYHDQTLVPTPTDVSIQDGRLIVKRAQNESGCLVVPWPVNPLGTIVVTSSTLRERPEPYRLLVELARGKLNQVRSQAAEWQAAGMRTSPQFARALSEATRLFGSAALAANQHEADTIATRVLEQTHALADQLTRDFVEQTLENRHEAEGRLDTRLTTRYQRAPRDASEYTRAFNAANVCFRWRDVEQYESQYDWTQADEAVAAAKAAKLPLTVGPIIDLAPGMLPDWAASWEADLPALAAFMCDYLETALTRYKKDARRWIICAGFNHDDALGLVDDDRLRLAFRLFEAAAQVDPGLELILSVAQPWGDYLVSEDQTISPLTFPDDLVRAGVRLAAIELEIQFGRRPRGSIPRDLLDTARLFHAFGKLGPPLEVALSMPSAVDTDPNATRHTRVSWADSWKATLSPTAQADWGAAIAALALSWQKVRTVTWEQWSDAEPHLVPLSGILDANNSPKPLLARFRDLRAEHL